ncbi:MAG: MFS transporter [Desulfovibrionaceae bacterium]
MTQTAAVIRHCEITPEALSPLDGPSCETTKAAEALNLKRALLSSFVGATLEWYDFFLYGAVAGLVFGRLYFPGFEPVVATILSYATFAVGYVGRAFGGIVFGHFGDKLGRKKMLILTLWIMGIGTTAIGCVPTAAQIGIWAPILLILCRLLQGIGLGGEWGGAILMSVESAPRHKRAFYGTLPQVGLAVGLLLASGVIGFLSIFLSEEAFMTWGWRSAFISSFVLLFVGNYIRNKVSETKDFAEVKAKNAEVKSPLMLAFKRYPKMMVACMGARCIDGVAFAVFSVYSLSFLTTHGMPRSTALMVVTVASLFMGICMPLWGLLADKVGKTTIFGINSFILAGASFFAFWIFRYHADSFILAVLALGLTFGVIYSGIFGIMSSMFADSFEPSIRYSAMSFVYQVSGIPTAGCAPMLATFLVAANGGDPWYLCWFICGIGIMSGLCTVWMTRLKNSGYCDSYTVQ